MPGKNPQSAASKSSPLRILVVAYRIVTKPFEVHDIADRVLEAHAAVR